MSSGSAETPRARPVRAGPAVLLLGLALLLVFLALEPYLSFAIFGSDTGEYYTLTAHLLAFGNLPHGAAYGGWGTSYPDFPGLFLVAGAGAGALGLGAFTALTVLVPVVAVLSVFPLFLLLRRLYPNDTVALLGATVASLALPRLFSIAHPAPLALGDFLSVAALWTFVESRRDARWLLPFAWTSGALIVTHHLSTYFLLVGAAGGLFLLELWRPRLWSRRFPTRELVVLGALATATLVYWFYGTTTFVGQVILPGLGGTPGVGFAALEGFVLALLVLIGAIVWVRRRSFRPRRAWVRMPTTRSVARDALWLSVVIFGLAGALLVVPIPGTSQRTSVVTILWFCPLLALGILCAGSRSTLTAARLGPFSLTWAGALGLSAAAALGVGLLGPQFNGLVAAIPASRHAEYLFLPVGLLVGVGAARLVAGAADRAGRRGATAVGLGIVVVLAANAALVYPPPSSFGGFEEGLTHADSAMWMWVGLAVPAGWTVATDHRLSSMVFGFDGNRATWVSTPNLFNGDNWSRAAAELRSTGVPNPARPAPIDLVLVDSVMYGGVALDPSALAVPLSPSALAWFGGLPFVPLYEDGPNVAYLVDASAFPAG